MNSRLIPILTVVVGAICAAAIWFLNSQPQTPVVPQTASTTVTPTPDIPRPKPTPSEDEPDRTARTELPATKVEPAQAAKPMAEWEIKIENILQRKADEAQTAQMLINILPSLPPEGQAEAAQHISNLVADKDYNKIAPFVKNPGLSEEVLDVFVTDLMNREDEVKLPVLLDIAKIPNHPHHEEAATDLQIFLDEDYGTDWSKWDVALKGYLKKRAVENAAAEKEAAAEASGQK